MNRNLVCVTYNHPFPQTVDAVRNWNSQFGDVTIVTPPGGGGDVEYYAGPYLFQAAIVEFLKARRPVEGYTVVVGDDLVLNPNFDLEALKGFPDPDQFVFAGDGVLPVERFCDARTDPSSPRRLDEAPAWAWTNNVAIAMLDPISLESGSGEANPTAMLRASEIWRANSARLDAMPGTRWAPVVGRSPEWVELHVARLLDESGHVSIDIPLFFGYSDFLVFPNARAGMIADFLARTVRAKLFVESAIPTMLAWSGLPTTLLHGRLDIRWLDSRNDFDFDGVDAIRIFFDENPDCIGIHPVKWSRMV